MNKVEVGLLIVTICIIAYVGGLVYYEMATELEEHPEIKDIGGPPVISDLRILVAVVGTFSIAIVIILKFNPVDKENKI